MNQGTWMIGAIVVGSLALTGCASTTNATNRINSSSNQTTSGTVPTSSSTNTTVGGSRSGNATSAANSTATSGNATSAIALVKQSMVLAKQGKAIDIPFALKQNITSVQDAWGKPDSQNSAGAGIYATFNQENAAFGLNKGEQIFDVRSYSSKLKSITPSDVKSALGQPGDTRQTSDSVIYMYPAGIDYQLLFVFPKNSKGDVGATVNHVSVFWPKGTIDIMAETQPAPSVVVDNQPGSVGSLFTFSIQNPPKGYRLVELEWIPSKGTPIINTFQQAVANGASSTGSNLEFNISGDGQTYSFIYPSSQRGQSGTVRVIYQDTSGRAMIGSSSQITLK